MRIIVETRVIVELPDGLSDSDARKLAIIATRANRPDVEPTTIRDFAGFGKPNLTVSADAARYAGFNIEEES